MDKIDKIINETDENHFEESDRVVSAQITSVIEQKSENVLRPNTFEYYIGQHQVKKNLQVFIDAARMRKEALDHVLLHGPPGLGKTTLAFITANALGVQIKMTAGHAIEKAGDLAAVLTNLEKGDVLFIDEIHRLPSSVEEVLYTAMEDFQLDITIGQGPSARIVRIDIAPFTLIGATTKTGNLTSPLRDRFGIVCRLEYYNEEELARIVTRSSQILNFPITSEGAREIARRSRGTPRIANRFLRRVRDFAQVDLRAQIDGDIARQALNELDVDPKGLDYMDRLILQTIVEKYGGGPVGLDNLAMAVGEVKDTLEEVYESYLVFCGFIQRTARGRVATAMAYEHLGLPVKNHND